MSDILDDNEDYQEDTPQVEDNEVIDDEQDIDDSQDDEQDDDTEQDDSADDDALEFSFDDDGDEKDEFAGKPAPEWVKNTRNENRELKRQLRELQKQQSQPEQQELREMPSIADYDYDEQSPEYKADLERWIGEKQEYNAAVQAEQQKYQQYRDRYKADVDAIKTKAPDYDEVESSVVEVLSEQKQGLLQMLVDNPAKIVYALGKNSPAQLERLSELDDVQFTKQIVLMEQQMSSKSKSRNQNKPKPKTHELEGAAGGVDTKLAKLEAEAAKTGDRSKVIAYKRNK
ncbi:hypothetical protein ACTXGL_01390 [Psychrobacter sp. T6-6]|uniref:hypothetical protein n=1 Tax=Psychrobacter sp. T6-6 TaxID=3457452 RepID=UPI003FD5E9D5